MDAHTRHKPDDERVDGDCRIVHIKNANIKCETLDHDEYGVRKDECARRRR